MSTLPISTLHNKNKVAYCKQLNFFSPVGNNQSLAARQALHTRPIRYLRLNNRGSWFQILLFIYELSWQTKQWGDRYSMHSLDTKLYVLKKNYPKSWDIWDNIFYVFLVLSFVCLNKFCLICLNAFQLVIKSKLFIFFIITLQMVFHDTQALKTCK